jgi:hypothetical protein
MFIGSFLTSIAMACFFKLDDECHQVRKGQHVCKSCWTNASPQKQDSLKDHPSYTNYFCQAFQCWEFPDEGGSVCEHHVHARSRSPRRTRSVETMETPQSDAVQSSILPSIETIETA